MDTITSLDQLISLMQERDEVHAEYTSDIATMLYPTVLSALQEILEAKDNQIDWAEITMSPEDLTLRIVCAIQYGETDHIPTFVAAVSSPTGPNPEGDVRLVRVGIPITYSFRPKDEILAFFKQLIAEGQQPSTGYKATEDAMQKSPDSGAQVAAQFDLSNLSKDQVAQLIALQNYTSGEKH